MVDLLLLLGCALTGVFRSKARLEAEILVLRQQTPRAQRRPRIVSSPVLGKRHLRQVLLSYMKYFNEVRAHLSLNKDAPVPRAVQAAGRILCQPILGGLHQQYGRT
jgi:hypothetical protein